MRENKILIYANHGCVFLFRQTYYFPINLWMVWTLTISFISNWPNQMPLSVITKNFPLTKTQTIGLLCVKRTNSSNYYHGNARKAAILSIGKDDRGIYIGKSVLIILSMWNLDTNIVSYP